MTRKSKEVLGPYVTIRTQCFGHWLHQLPPVCVCPCAYEKCNLVDDGELYLHCDTRVYLTLHYSAKSCFTNITSQQQVLCHSRPVSTG